MPTPVAEVRDPTTNLVATLLNNQWADIHGRYKFSIHIMISGSVSLTVRGSNEPAPNDATDDGVDIIAAGLTQIAAASNTISASTIVKFNNPMLWAKIKATISAGGSLQAFLVGV